MLSGRKTLLITLKSQGSSNTGQLGKKKGLTLNGLLRSYGSHPGKIHLYIDIAKKGW